MSDFKGAAEAYRYLKANWKLPRDWEQVRKLDRFFDLGRNEAIKGQLPNPERSPGHLVRDWGGQHNCIKCGRIWDYDDTEPTECK